MSSISAYYGVMVPAELKRQREAYGLTQQELAEALGVHRVTYAQWETGRYALPVLLPHALKAIGYQLLRRRNQPIIERCAVRSEDYAAVVDRLGLRGTLHDVPMFDAHDNLIYWWLPPDGPYAALGEAREGGRCYLVPRSLQPQPEIRLPDAGEIPGFVGVLVP